VEVLQLITEYDKRIYNTYLKVSRGSNNLPFKYRKDFEKLDEKAFVAIKKVSSFLRKFPHIKMEEYFKAPYALYPDEKHFPLDYYFTLKATKAYTLYNKKQTMKTLIVLISSIISKRPWFLYTISANKTTYQYHNI